MTASARTVRLWLHDRVCVGYTVAAPYCIGAARVDHANRTQRETARTIVAAETLEDLAVAVHDALCPVWAQQAHGGHYERLAVRTCGTGGDKHAKHLEQDADVLALAEALGLPRKVPAVLAWAHDTGRDGLDEATLTVGGVVVDRRFVESAEEEGPYTLVEDAMLEAAGVDRADVTIECNL